MRYPATVILSLTALLASAEEPKAAAPATEAKVYETDRYGNRGDQAFVVKDDKV